MPPEALNFCTDWTREDKEVTAMSLNHTPAFSSYDDFTRIWATMSIKNRAKLVRSLTKEELTMRDPQRTLKQRGETIAHFLVREHALDEEDLLTEDILLLADGRGETVAHLWVHRNREFPENFRANTRVLNAKNDEGNPVALAMLERHFARQSAGIRGTPDSISRLMSSKELLSISNDLGWTVAQEFVSRNKRFLPEIFFDPEILKLGAENEKSIAEMLAMENQLPASSMTPDILAVPSHRRGTIINLLAERGFLPPDKCAPELLGTRSGAVNNYADGFGCLMKCFGRFLDSGLDLSPNGEEGYSSRSALDIDGKEREEYLRSYLRRIPGETLRILATQYCVPAHSVLLTSIDRPETYTRATEIIPEIFDEFLQTESREEISGGEFSSDNGSDELYEMSRG